MTDPRFGLVLATLGLLLSACANSAAERRVDEKVARETSIQSRSDLLAESDRLIRTAPNFSDEQRAQLLALRDSSLQKSETLRLESLRLRSVLIKNLVAQPFDPKLIERLKTEITRTEEKRLSVFFASIRGVNRILGRSEQKRPRLSREYDEDGRMLRMLDPYLD